MSKAVVFDDDFVLRELQPVAGRWPTTLDPAMSRRVARTRLEVAADRTRELFRRHRGVTSHPQSGDLPELRLLNLTLEIVALVLNLEPALTVIERVIEVDWKAHLDLRKEKRYRDHITHPARVTAIGWWLLHREDQALLEALADHYEQATRAYRATRGIDAGEHSWRALVQFAWLAAGLLHDTLYPAEYHLRAGANLKECACDLLGILAPHGPTLTRAPGRKRLLAPVAGSWFSGALPSLDKRVADLPNAGFKHCHALLGALHHLTALGDSLHTLPGLVSQLASRAIATHHDDKDSDAIAADPLALLLYVADNLQAWNRPFLHVETPTGRGHLVRPLIECERIELKPESAGYVAEFWMNPDAVDMALLKGDPYGWRFDRFAEPQRLLESRLAGHSALPRIVLSETRCIQPGEFLAFMEP